MRRFFLLLAVLLALLIPVESFAGPFMVLPKRGSAWGAPISSISVSGIPAAQWMPPSAGWEAGYLDFGKYDSTEYASVVYFPFVDIPKGATIQSATLSMKASANWSGTTCNAKIHGNNVDHAAFPADAASAEALALTDGVEWNNIGAWTSGNTYTSPDISSVIQDIVNRDGWSRLNALQIVTRNNGSSDSAFRQSAQSDGITLSVTYSSTPVADDYVSIMDGAVVSAGSTHVSSSPDNAADNDPLTYWNNNNTLPDYWKIDCGSPVIANRLVVFKGSYSNAFAAFTINGSNDDDSYTQLYSGTDPISFGAKVYDFTNTTAYRYYKIIETSSYNGSWIAVNEFMFMREN